VASSSTKLQPAKSVPKDAKEAALALDSASLTSFSFDVPTETTSKHEKERSEAAAAEPSSLLVFSFTFGTTAPGSFDWEAAGMKPPAKASGSWTCGTCMVSNDAAKTKCVACEEPRPNSTTNGAVLPTVISHPKLVAAPTSGFDWAAAGMKMPTKAPGSWACQVCMVDNDAARVKCISCDEPKPDLTITAPEPAKPALSGGFNWAAAGMKMPTKAPGIWTCKVCMIDNDPSKAKCVSCEEPRA
jgi:hypothetical protein